ncbi:TPA: hypothetical protein ACP6PI_004992 [Escherichia coli]|uniref:hypothetical protein n=1 Tax=Escherichia phage vB_EcoS_XY1 TaxID=2681674 RepID=UPI0013EFFFE1|nr:hypothetical protein QCF80_gp37 [Escherichia phage vB_EcoS_XY1]MDT1709919.1 hypothetical protein [Escherichia coli]QIG59228.1 hypothetical protein GT371_00037 [Escherichia phage vB_EcoS_XY1]WFD55351.1 hypothetical protein JSSK01_04 [Escherichia phage JSSK01]HDN1096017.1 hypothetical protein [Escherichia coli]
MKVKAAKILWLAALDYVTEGKVYDVYNPTATGFGYIDSDDDCYIFIDFGNDEGDGFHGVKWEIVE